MEYTINQLAKLAGVTTRTLRHYHQIGLLAPARVSSSGYRIYGPAQVDRLQHILFYRQLGLELTQIKDALDDKGFDAEQTIRQHLTRLRAQRAQMDAMIETAEATLQNIRGEKKMTDQEKFEGFKKNLIDENEEKYGEEVRQKYGDKTVDASNAKMMKMTEEQYAAFTALGEELNEALRLAVTTGDAKSEEAQHAAELHKQWLCYTWPSYSAEAHRGLVQMYVDDERFTAHYEAIAPGGAAFLRDAVNQYLDANMQ